MHVNLSYPIRSAITFSRYERRKGGWAVQSILTNLVQCILPFHIPFPHTVNVVQIKSRNGGSMQRMLLSLLNERMSFVDVGGVVFGRVDGIVAFMRARNVLALADNCTK